MKDSGVIGNALGVAKGIASALGKENIANKLGTAHDFAQSVGAGRKRKRARKSAAPKGRKLTKVAMKSRTQRAEVAHMDGWS